MRETESPLEVHVEHDSRIPKYLQIVNSIKDSIERGLLKVGQRVPSINEISEEYYLSRDTVEKAYNVLKEKQIIVSVKGKGYYVSRTPESSRLRILFLLNKLSSYKLKIYNSFINNLPANFAQVDLMIHHCDAKIFLSTLNDNIGLYDRFVVMPHFKDHEEHDRILEYLSRIPEDKLLVLDKSIPDLKKNVSSVYQDFKSDIYEALSEGRDILLGYKKLVLVYPRKAIYPYPIEILHGFQKFCTEFDIDFEVLDEIYPDMELQARDAYIIIEENDLVNLVKQVREQKFILGKDIGVISYNDTPLKDLLGITVISTDFQLMGETAAYMIMSGKKEMVKNAFRFINRNSA